MPIKLKDNLLGVFGMYEMEAAAKRIIEICSNTWKQRFSVGSFSGDEATGFVELLYCGWLNHGTYNGEFFVSQHFIERVQDHIVETNTATKLEAPPGGIAGSLVQVTFDENWE